MRHCGESPSGELLKAFGEFNRGDWFECHETLEDLWVGEEGEMRDFYQGLRLEGGTNYLQRVQPVCQRIDVAGLIIAAGRFHDALAALGPDRMQEAAESLIPRLVLVPSSQTAGEPANE
jgi:hypothetical protein